MLECKESLFHDFLLLKLQRIQCDQIGRFLKVLGYNSSGKSGPNIQGYCEKHYSFNKTAPFWARIQKFGLLFIPTSAHTVNNVNALSNPV